MHVFQISHIFAFAQQFIHMSVCVFFSYVKLQENVLGEFYFLFLKAKRKEERDEVINGTKDI